MVVATGLQVRAWQRRLAEAGGALGVRVTTFDALYRDILRAAGEHYVLLTEPIQYRLLRALLDDVPLAHYAPLRTYPGFVQVLQGFVREMKAGAVHPDALTGALETLGGEPRLLELARLYAAYQTRVQREGWADFAGLGWLAVEALERNHDAGCVGTHLFVDGFDDLSSVQARVLALLAGRVDALVIALTGDATRDARPFVHHRFRRTRERLEAALGIQAEPLPGGPQTRHAPVLAHLESSLFAGDGPPQPAADRVTLIAAPDREAEVRAALRWLKARVIHDGVALRDAALLARDVAPYRAFIRQTAAEFGVPLHLLDGRPLRSNPAIAALLDLLRLTLPDPAAAFPWRRTVAAWRSPYFDWSALEIAPASADALERVARWGRVIAGVGQWHEAFELLAASAPADSANVPTGEAARALRATFDRFVQRITPPPGAHPCRDFVAWIEALIGDAAPAEEDVVRDDLGVARRALSGSEALQSRDLAALNAFKDVLRGLVWADEAVACAPVGFAAFCADLVAAVEAATTRLLYPTAHAALLVADVTQARGVPFRAVAVLGLAEGEFPATLAEDPFLRDADRARLREDFGLALAPSPDNSEAEYFYEAITRPRDYLLLTRPRIADNGAPWQASPYWDEVRRRVDVAPQRLTSHSYPAPAAAASVEELLMGMATVSGPAWERLAARYPARIAARIAALDRATSVLAERSSGRDPGLHTGNLTSAAAEFSQRFGPGSVWSASRLESYRACPFWFFVSRVLRLESRPVPAVGLDAAQLGSLYHAILEQLYQAVADPADLDQLLAALPEVARSVLDAAPREQQFRPTAWWEQTRAEIEATLRQTVTALHEQRGDFVPQAYEQRFGLGEIPALTVREGADAFRLRGLIDRVDRAPDGRVRIIDYKLGGKTGYSNAAFERGEKLQLPLYALAARDALGLGDVADGFYWHVRSAEHSSFTLAKFGVAQALETAVAYAWEAVRGARSGHFVPHPPLGNCPDYCPTVAFCWHYEAKQW